ncbi:unnamed protein product, partial [Mesorhabditis spiculigera]
MQHEVVTVQRDDGTLETRLGWNDMQQESAPKLVRFHLTVNTNRHSWMLSPDEEVRRSGEVELDRNEPQPSSPKPTKKKLEFNMASKIQIIPNNRQGQLNTGYIGTLGGVMKIAEIALSFMAFVLSICSDRRTTTAAWTEHISFECMIGVAVLLLGYVCFPHITLRDELTREGLIVVELIFYALNTLFYFISIWLMIHLSAAWGTDGRGAAVMTAILCVALTIFFAIETFMKAKAWRGENEPSGRTVQTGPANA